MTPVSAEPADLRGSAALVGGVHALAVADRRVAASEQHAADILAAEPANAGLGSPAVSRSYGPVRAQSQQAATLAAAQGLPATCVPVP